MERDRITIIGTEIGLIAEIEVNPIIEEEETFTIIEIIDLTIELEVSLEMVMGMEMATDGMVDMTVDQIIEETIIDKTAETKSIGIEAQVKTAVGPGQNIEIIQGTTIGMDPTTEIKIGIEIGQAVEMMNKELEQLQEIGMKRIGAL